MDKKTNLFLLVVALLSVVSAAEFEDKKNYFPIPVPVPDPYTEAPPTVTPTPSHGGNNPKTPVNCGTPPSGGGSYHPKTPTTPVPVPKTPTTPIPDPKTPTTPTYVPKTPTTPIPDPKTPIFPTPTPTITFPSPPSSVDPTSPPYSCIYWKKHPTLIWGLFGFWGTTCGTAFGATSLPGLPANTNLLEALSNTRTDGYGDLYREGTAALLNSMVHGKFPFTTGQVRDSFIAALSSDKSAATQAQLFKTANEDRA